MKYDWTNSNLERMTFDDSEGTLSYIGESGPTCQVCKKEIHPNDICMPFPSSIVIEGIAHKACMADKNAQEVEEE